MTTNEILDVLVVGAGPTGLTLAYELASQGLSVRIIDKLEFPSDKSKALGVQARSLEVLERHDLAHLFVEEGLKIKALNIFVDRKPAFHMSMSPIESHYNFVLGLPQTDTERILTEQLAGLNVNIERLVQLTDFSQSDDGVLAVLEHSDGRNEKVKARYLVGCDGAHSTVRHLLRIGFEGSPYPEEIYLVDVKMDLPLPENEACMFSANSGVLGFLPLPGGSCRIIADRVITEPEPIPEPSEGEADQSLATTRELSLEDMQKVVDERGPEGVVLQNPLWIAAFKIHRRIASKFRLGRVFLAGDSAHIHSPAGGQGMNTGIQDAVNLGWKLALVCKGKAYQSLLDTYQEERYPVAEEVLKNSDMATKSSLMQTKVVRKISKVVLPVIMSSSFMQENLRNFLTELKINYRKSSLSSEYHESVLKVTSLAGSNPNELSLSEWLDFGAGPKPGERALIAEIKDLRTGMVKDLARVMRGSRFHVLLFSGVDAAEEVLMRLAELGGDVLDAYGDMVSVHLVTTEEELPADLDWSGSVLYDFKKDLHQLYHAKSECLYLIRPDWYIGYRAQPSSSKRLLDYLDHWLMRFG